MKAKEAKVEAIRRDPSLADWWIAMENVIAKRYTYAELRELAVAATATCSGVLSSASSASTARPHSSRNSVVRPEPPLATAGGSATASRGGQ